MHGSRYTDRSWVDVSDDDLDNLSGGIPHFDNMFGGYQEEHFDDASRRSRTNLPVLQDRPTNDPDLWF